MLRIRFTPDDLVRIKIAEGPDTMWEIGNSVQTLFRADAAHAFDMWRKQVRPQLSLAAHRLRALLPPQGYSPDFLTPVVEENDMLDASIEAVLMTPRTILRRDLARMKAGRSDLSWLNSLAEGEPNALRELGCSFRSYFDEAVSPYWPRICAHISSDLHIRTESLLRGGAEELLKGLGPDFRWEPPVLAVTGYPVRQDLHLDGRGITLQPSFFCSPGPVSLADPELPPVVVYPIHHERKWSHWHITDRAACRRDPLGALMGHTRAGILREIARGAWTTGRLAQRLGVTGPAVSQHISVLRDAGLVHSFRVPGKSQHVATAEGHELLSWVDHSEPSWPQW